MQIVSDYSLTFPLLLSSMIPFKSKAFISVSLKKQVNNMNTFILLYDSLNC